MIVSGGEAAGPPPGIEVSVPRTVGFADAFDYVVEATVPPSDAETAELTAEVGPFTVLDAEPDARATPAAARSSSGSPVASRAWRTAAWGQRSRCAPSFRRLCSSLRRAPSRGGRRSSGSMAGSLRRRCGHAGRVPSGHDRAAGERDEPHDGCHRTHGDCRRGGCSALCSSWSRCEVVPPSRATTRWRARSGSSGSPAGRPEVDRRRAADLLARTAADRDRSPLAADAMRIAWAPSPPTPRTVVELAASATRETT